MNTRPAILLAALAVAAALAVPVVNATTSPSTNVPTPTSTPPPAPPACSTAFVADAVLTDALVDGGCVVDGVKRTPSTTTCPDGRRLATMGGLTGITGQKLTDDRLAAATFRLACAR